MESDSGAFLPMGLEFTGSDKARAIMKEVMSLLQPLNITNVFSDGEGTDINFWIQAGVPGKTESEDDVALHCHQLKIKSLFQCHRGCWQTMHGNPMSLSLR